MSNIKIPVEASFDGESVRKQLEQFQSQLNKLGQQIAQANKIKFEPVTKATVDDMRRVGQQFEALKRVSGDLNKRINATGQKGASFFDLDWSKLYPDPNSRNRQMAKTFEYVSGVQFAGAPVQAGGGGGRGRTGGSGIVHQVADAGMRATGPAGGVAANAVNTGMSAGFGAGLMGLMGGLLALGVGKAVGAVMEKMGQAEDNAVSYDRLKRTLGDVNVSFDVLKASNESFAKRLSVTFDEAARLTTQFSKLGNVTDDQYRTLANEAGVGVGLSRSFGLDSGVGVGVLGQMRGMRITNNEQETRKMALLIGETIGKSDAFAKSDEVMEALANYAVSQTRQSMGAANIAGYAGQFSAMVGSGIPGLDPTGSAGLLSRINATLSAGGARGEASQFFTSMIGQSMGLDVFQTQVLREGGASASLDEAFGAGSVASRYGMDGPSGSETFLQASLGMLRQKYGHNPGLLAKATSEHLGISMRQAMAMLSIQPNQMGEIGAYAGDLTNLNDKGIANLTRVVTGTDADRRSIASELLGRTGSDRLSEDESARLQRIMNEGSTEDQKRVLAELVKSRDQEETQGKNIYESKVALDNLKTAMADKLIPLTQNIRDGILWMAGDRKMTASEVLKEIAEKESGVLESRIRGQAENELDDANKRYLRGRREILLDPNNSRLKNFSGWEETQAKIKAGTATQEEVDALVSAIEKRIKIGGARSIGDDIPDRLAGLERARQSEREAIEKKQSEALETERIRLKAQKDSIDKQHADQISAEAKISAERQRLESGGKINQGAQLMHPGDGVRRQPVRQNSSSMVNDPQLRDYVRQKELEIGAPEGSLWAQLGVESSYNPNAISVAGAEGIGQIMPATRRSLERRMGKRFDPFNAYDSVDMQTEVMKENFSRFGNWSDAFRAYNGGWKRSNWNNPETMNYVPKISREMQNPQGTPLPQGELDRVRSEEQRVSISAQPMEVIVKNERGAPIQPAQQVNFNVSKASPFGMTRVS